MDVSGIDPGKGALVIALTLAGIAFFASAEASIIALSKVRIRTLAEQGKANAQLLQRLIQKRERLAGTILLGENTLIVVATTVMAYLMLGLMHGHPARAALLVVLAMVALVVLLGEIIPRTFGAQNADRYALLIARPLALAVRALSLPVLLLTSVTRVYVQLFNVVFRTRQQVHLPLVAEEELRQLLADVQEQGGLEKEETEMIASVIGLSDTAAHEIMVPRIHMVCLPVDASFDEALNVAIERGHSRIPVYQDSSDNIVGVLYVKDLLAIIRRREHPEGIPPQTIRPAYHVPESKKVDELLKDMRTERVHMAIVLDEFGGTAGLITIEDILEEIVGEIQDEHDPDARPEIQPQPDGSLLVEGKVHVADVAELLGVKLPEDDFATIGGFVVGLLGRAPTQGEEVTYDGVRMRVEVVEQRRAAGIRVWRRQTMPLDLDQLGLGLENP
jgi:CBS domain containing-hemolysin-like protein